MYTLPHKIGTILLALLALALFNGCTRLNYTSIEQAITGETDLIEFSYTIADDLTEMAYPPLALHRPDMPLVVTTFVDNNDLASTSHFGRVLQEHISSRLVQLGYIVKELKWTGQLMIEEKSGETILSRDLSKINPTADSQAVLVGTISISGGTMYVSARFINPVDRKIISSTDYRLHMDDEILAMQGYRKDYSMDEIDAPSRSVLDKIFY